MTMRLFGLCAGLLSASCAATMNPLLREASQIPAIEARYEAPIGEEMAGPLAGLIQRLASWGVPVNIVKPDDLMVIGSFGVTDMTARVIQLDERMSVDARFEVLAHEGAHLFQPRLIDRDAAEVFADITAAGVCAFYGRDVRSRFASYVAGFKGGFSAEPAMRVDIALAVRVLTGQAEPPAAWRERR